MDKTRIEWRTPFNTRVTHSATLVSQGEDAAPRTYVYDLGRAGKAYRYKFVRVVTPRDEAQSTGWSVTGFQTRQDLDANRRDDALPDASRRIAACGSSRRGGVTPPCVSNSALTGGLAPARRRPYRFQQNFAWHPIWVLAKILLCLPLSSVGQMARHMSAQSPSPAPSPARPDPLP